MKYTKAILDEDGIEAMRVRRPGREFCPAILFFIKDLEPILEEGFTSRAKNNRGCDTNYYLRRDILERELWGTTEICYGFNAVEPITCTLSYYGDALFILKKTRLKGRVTVCDGDSMNRGLNGATYIYYQEMQVIGKLHASDIKRVVLQEGRYDEKVLVLLDEHKIKYNVLSQDEFRALLRSGMKSEYGELLNVNRKPKL